MVGNEYVAAAPCIIKPSRFGVSSYAVSSSILCPMTPSICAAGTSAFNCCGATTHAAILPPLLLLLKISIVYLLYILLCLFFRVPKAHNLYLTKRCHFCQCYFLPSHRIIANTTLTFCTQSITITFIRRPAIIGRIHLRIIRNTCNVIR